MFAGVVQIKEVARRELKHETELLLLLLVSLVSEGIKRLSATVLRSACKRNASLLSAHCQRRR